MSNTQDSAALLNDMLMGTVESRPSYPFEDSEKVDREEVV